MNKKGVKEAYYKFLLNHYEDNKDFDFTVLPNSKSRNLKISCAMPKLMKIIKNDYVLKRKPLNIETKELLRIYNEETKAMVAKSHGSFDKWIMQQINAWDSDFEHQSILHIHGDGDIVFPIKYIGDCYVIKGGTHAMLINRPKEIAKVISHFLHLPITED